MANEEAKAEILSAIEWYDARGLCWLSVVTYIGIKALFGSWYELVASVRRPWRKGTVDAPGI